MTTTKKKNILVSLFDYYNVIIVYNNTKIKPESSTKYKIIKSFMKYFNKQKKNFLNSYYYDFMNLIILV